MDEDVARALAQIRQEINSLESALGVHESAQAETVVQRLVNAVENQGDHQQREEQDLSEVHRVLESLVAWARTHGFGG